MDKGKVLGLGGIFFQSRDPKRLCAWYRDCLGLEIATDFDETGVQRCRDNSSVSTHGLN